MEQTRAGSGIVNPVPRSRRRSGTAKIQTVKGSRVEICKANTTRPFTGWIGGADGKDFIVLDEELWYNKRGFFASLGDKANR